MPQAKEIDDINWLSNSNKIGYGYNPIRGDPVCYTGDCHMSGFGRSIFQLDYTNPPQGSCTTKLIPKNVELDCIPSTEPKLELSDNFRYVIQNLPATGTYTSAVKKYIQDYIINYFGFTYITELLLGGIAQMTTVINQSSIVPLQQEGISGTEMVQLSFSKIFNFNYNENEMKNLSKFETFQRYVKSSMATIIGGEIYKNDQKLNEWFQTIPDNPVIIKFTIQSIFDLITPERFLNDTNIQEKAGYIMQALEEYVNKTSTVYCENQCTNAAQGTCQPLGAYAYGICVFMTVVIDIFRIQRAISFVQALSRARAATYIVWKITDEPSNINNYLEIGLKKDDLIGDIHFSNIHFSYPSRPDVPILKGLSFDVKRGQTVALVGLSGSGKSTCIQLLQRFYDPSSGSILIDGKQINEYNLKWLRQHIGVVSQEPVLFHTTIRQNILLGSDSATDEEMYQAAKMANAHTFIMTLPDKYETKIGERGATLSGGQKQRIAIALALIRDPKILLLDEATSALDSESEKIVQEALDRAAQSRTTLVIAHRLSTIRYADKIIVMQQGEIVEEGDHESLMQIKGVYYGLVQQQSLRQAEEEEEEEFEQKKAAEMFLFDQTNSDYFDIRRNHGSTIVSISPSIFSLLYRNRNYTVSEEDNESYLFACSGEILTKRLRSKAFRAILRQESAYFDQAQHSTGALCTRLATEASAVQGASDVHFGIIFQSLLSMISGIFLGFAFSWQLTLLIMAFLPFLLLGSISRIRLTARFERKDNKILENAGK
ncbi:unnamed protein product, partial [Rotaria sordida]